jgi:hypothetical protein
MGRYYTHAGSIVVYEDDKGNCDEVTPEEIVLLLHEKDREIEELKEEVAVRDAVMDWNIEKHESLCNGLKALRDEMNALLNDVGDKLWGTWTLRLQGLRDKITELLGEEHTCNTCLYMSLGGDDEEGTHYFVCDKHDQAVDLCYACGDWRAKE